MKTFGEAACEAAERASDQTPGNNLVVCYFLKLHNTTCSIMILLDGGLVHDAKVLARTQFENMVYLVASTKEKDFFSRFQKEFAIEKNKQLSALSQRNKRSGKLPGVSRLEIQKPQIEKMLSNLKGKRIDLDKLVVEYSLGEEYSAFYQGCNSVVHSLPYTMLEYHKSGFVRYPDLGSADLTARIAFWCYLKSVRSVIVYFKLDSFTHELEELEKITAPPQDGPG